MMRCLRFIFRDKKTFSDNDIVATPRLTEQWDEFPEHASWFDSEFLAFHGTSLWAANNISKSGVSNLLDTRGIRKEVVAAVEILKTLSKGKCVRDVISDCARKKGVSVPIGFDDAILGIFESDENKMLSYGSLYVSYRLDVAIKYAFNGPELREILEIFLRLASNYMKIEQNFTNTVAFVSEEVKPVVLVISLRNAEIFSEGGHPQDITSEYDEMRSLGLLTGTAKISNLRDDKVLGYFDLSDFGGDEEMLLQTCTDEIGAQRRLYGSMLYRWRTFPS